MNLGKKEAIVRILIADHQPVVLEGLALILKNHDKIRVVGLIKNGSELTEKIKQLVPDILILDTSMPEFDILACIRSVKEKTPETRIICTSESSAKDEILSLTYAGIDGYLPKGSLTDDIRDAVIKVINGGKYFPADVTEMIISTVVSRHQHPGYKGDALFSESEMEIILLTCESKTVKEISVRLTMNIRTLEAAKKRIMKKMRVKNVMGLVSYAIKNRIVNLDALPE